MTQVEVGGRFIRSGFSMLLLGMVMSFGMVLHYVANISPPIGTEFLKTILLWYACPWTLSTAVVLGGALGMIAIGAVYAILGRMASADRVEGLEKSALSLCTFALIAIFLTGFVGYFAADRELIPPFLQWRYNGRSAGNGWNSPVNNAQWGTDYVNRTAIAKSNILENRPTETKYINTDDDGQGKQLTGQNNYSITFPKGQLPPAKGFWSVTLYNAEHFFNPNPLKRYSLGTKNKNLKYNPDGSLTLYAGAKSPGMDKESNWLPAPNGAFSLYIRAYWPDMAIVDGSWQPPTVSMVE